MTQSARNNALSVLFLSISAVAASGCANNEELAALRESASYHVGYNDGCQTSNEEDKSFSTKTKRDQVAFDSDKAYRTGWRQGYLECQQNTRDAINGGRILGERNEY